jgi:glycerate dehydrogenase
MKIVFLDSYTLNPGDLSWSTLDELGDIQYYPRSKPSEILDRCTDAEVIISNKAILTRELISQLPKLKLICVAATGYNNVDLVAAKKYNIVVTNVSAYSTASVTQHVFAMLLSYLNKVAAYNADVREGRWSKAEDFCFTDHTIPALENLVLGVMGYGNIGRSVALVGKAMGMEVIALNKYPERFPNDEVEYVSQDVLLQRSDVLSLHVPLSDRTKKIINKELLSKLKENCILINTSRGPLINEQDLYEALENRIIAAALLDVLSEEPPVNENVLCSSKYCYITPHQAWANVQSRQNLLDGLVRNIKAFYDGQTINVVN